MKYDFIYCRLLSVGKLLIYIIVLNLFFKMFKICVYQIYSINSYLTQYFIQVFQNYI